MQTERTAHQALDLAGTLADLSAELAVVEAVEAPDLPCAASCRAATSHAELCECSCESRNHGVDHRAGRAAATARMQSRYVVAGFDRNMLAEIDDEAW